MAVQPRLYIHTLGCPKNDADSDTLVRRLRGTGVELVGDPSEAAYLLINTCGFMEEAREESIAAILGAARDYPKARLLVMGCLVQRYRDELAAGIPEVQGWYGLRDTAALVADLGSLVAGAVSSPPAVSSPAGASPPAEALPVAVPPPAGRSDTVADGPWPGPPPPDPLRSYAYIKISDGCDHGCSFCAIPGIKGPYVALSPDEILEQAGAALDEGARELVLVGQDTAIWSSDTLDLAGLLDAVAADPRVRWIRLMYLQPEHVDDALLATLAGNDKVVRYLDIPFQHAAARVLRRMSRRGDGDSYLALLARARRILPDVSLRTTFIVGFPGETEDESAALLEFCAAAAFDHGGAFVYSPEQSTPAYRLRPRVPAAIAEERLGGLSSALLSTAEQANRGRVGRPVEVMIDAVGATEGPEGVVAVGRTSRQAPEVDGVTYLEGDLPPGASPGDLVRAVITEAFGYDLIARCDAT